MRTTVTLDADLAVLLRRVMRERRMSFKAALNQVLREGLRRMRPGPARRYRLRAHRMGHRPEVPLDKALRLAAALEDEERGARPGP